MYTAITLTGDRPAALSFCMKYVLRQTVLPVEHIIIDDGIESCEQLCRSNTEYHQKDVCINYLRRERQLWEPVSTANRNLLKILPLIKTDKVIVFEDDDFYEPNHAEITLKGLEWNDYYGGCRTIYYNLEKHSWWQFKNQHPSFCQVGFTHAAIPEISRLARNWTDPFLDIQIWNEATLTKASVILDKPTMIGLKRMPGRLSQTSGHQGKGYHPDPSLTKFKELLGDEYKNYLPFIGK